MAKKMPKKTIIKKHTNPFLKKFFPVLIFAAILGAALFIAAQLAARQAVAPNAPESEPAAAACGANVVGRCGPAGGCLSEQKCQKTGTAIVRSETGNRTVNKYGCVSNRSCPPKPALAPYCSRGNLTSCLLGCIPTITGGRCKPIFPTPSPKPTIKTCYFNICGSNNLCVASKNDRTPVNEPCRKDECTEVNRLCKPTPTPKRECDPAVTLQKCNGNQPVSCNNFQWVNMGSACQFGCQGAGECLDCKPGSTRCELGDYFSREYVQKCNSQGEWVNVKKCDIGCVESGGGAYCTNVAG